MTVSEVARAALITGAAGGIGSACARRFGGEGAHVVCADVDRAGADAVVAELRATGVDASAVTCDVTDPDACRAAVATTLDAHGRLDVLVNVAGTGRLEPTEAVTVEQWSRTLAVNLTGTFLMCQRALPELVLSRGCIVNLASVAGVRAVPYNAAYCASKGGVVMLSKSLAVEYGDRGVRVNCVCPSSVDTPFLANFAFGEGVDRSLFERGRSVVQGLMAPEAVAAAVAYLASGDAAMITGTALMMDGGATA